jgi:hypothetical protein
MSSAPGHISSGRSGSGDAEYNRMLDMTLPMLEKTKSLRPISVGSQATTAELRSQMVGDTISALRLYHRHEPEKALPIMPPR